MGKTARDTFFLSRFDPAYLPHMFILVAIVIAATVAIYTRIADRFSLLPTVLVTFGIGAASLIAIQFSLNMPFIYAVLYVWMEVISTILTIQFWLLANRAFTTREARRLFGILVSGGSLASMIIGFSIRPFVKTYGTDYLLVITAGFIVLGMGVIYTLKPFVSDKRLPSIKPSPRQQNARSNHLLRKPYLKTITLTIVISTLVASLVDYQLKIIASETLDEAGLASLFGLLYGITGVISVFMQFLVTGRILSNMGILWGLMFLPVALITGNMMLLLIPVIMSAVITKAGDQVFRFTIHNTSNQLLWLPVPSKEKRQAKPFIDGTMKNSAQAISGLLILGMIQFFDVRFLSVPALLLLIVWILANFKLKRGYMLELRSAIEKRRLNFDSLEIDIQDPVIVDTLGKALREGDDHQKLFALETMKDLSLSPWISDLQNMFKKGSPLIQKKILELAREETDVISDENILTLIKSSDDAIAVEAIIICGERKLKAGIVKLQEILYSENYRQQSAAAASLMMAGEKNSAQARKILDRMIYDPSNEIQVAALQSVGHFPEIVTESGLEILLKDDSLEVRRLAINLARNRKNLNLLPHLIDNLENPITALPARKALKSYDLDVGCEMLLDRLNQDGIPKSLTIGIIRCLSEYTEGSSIDALIDRLDETEESVVKEIVNTLLKISRQRTFSDEQLIRIDKILNQTVRTVNDHLDLLRQFRNDDTAFLIKDHLTTSILREKTEILKLSLLRFPESPVETILHSISSGDPGARENALEILDNLLPRENREKILPLFDESMLNAAASVSKEETLAKWVKSKNEWVSVIALDYILKNKLSQILPGSPRRKGSVLHKEIMTKESPMYSTLEKTIFLKGVDLFQDISGEEVAHLAQIADETHMSPGEPVFKEGDAGDSMFIIVDGRVRIHKSEKPSGGEKEIAILSKGEFMGEMALLDQEPRSASATTREETVLLRINGEDFYDLLAGRMEIMQGIVKVLTRRLRKAIA